MICRFCNKEFEIAVVFRQRTVCPECKERVGITGSGTCSICGKYSVKRDQNGRGVDCDCSKNWYQKHNSSVQMRQQASDALKNFYKTDKGKEQLLQHNQSEQMRAQAREAGKLYGVQNLIDYNKSEQHKNTARETRLKFYVFDKDVECSNNCKKYTECGNSKNILKNIFGYCCESPSIPVFPNFRQLNNVRYYKGQNLEELCARLLSGKENIFDYPNFSIRFNRVCYNTSDILTDEKILLNQGNFTVFDVLYYYDKQTKEYVPWEEYKDNFKVTQITNEISSEFNGKYLNTFITKDSPMNCGHAAFDKLLLEKEVGWFVYIKFDEFNMPLVVGKSGSFNVNSSGCDLSFSKNIEDGPARLYLLEENLDWNYEQIYLVDCSSEEYALELEKEIQLKYNLFGG